MAIPARLAGIETEYAAFGYAEGGTRLPSGDVAERLLDQAAVELNHLPGCYHDMFLENGARFYMDEGGHPELSTAECADPRDVVRQAAAGDRILADLCRSVARIKGVKSVGVAKCNVDYSGAMASWGCHESYMHRAHTRELHKRLLPHLASRIVYSGAGGFDPTVPGLEFSISPRVSFLARPVSPSSTHTRGMIHTKDEPLGRREYHRLHLVCGEALCSHTSTWLKVGTTALITAAFESGHLDMRRVELKAPLDAMKSYATDPTLRARAETVHGKKLSALEIQRHYLEQIERQLPSSWMPPWARELCAAWRGVLDGLARDPLSLSGTLDWVIKWQLYMRHAQQRGFNRRSLKTWADYARNVQQAHLRARKAGVVRGRMAKFPPFKLEMGSGSEKLDAYLTLRNQLFELDFRFGQVGEAGLFNVLDASGVLDHRIVGDDEIEPARHVPPPGSRAVLRGLAVRELLGKSDVVCGWSRVTDRSAKRQLDLTDPFQTEMIWNELPPRETVLDDLPF